MFDQTVTSRVAPAVEAETPPASNRPKMPEKTASTAAPSTAPPAPSFDDLEIIGDRHRRVLWQLMSPRRRPSFTLPLLQEMASTSSYLGDLQSHEGALPFDYVVTASRMPGIYNLGGDLPQFAEMIRSGDREGLRRYARACVDVQAKRATNFDLPVCTISLVQGDALGGGFECALADDVIVAERSAKFGFPEILFGLFPGMGAYSFLTRRVSPTYAEELILSGKVYTAEEMHEAGLVDVLVGDGEGVQGVHEFLRREERRFQVRRAMHRLRRTVSPVSRQELDEITDVWVDTALTLGASEIRRMERLAQAQDRRWREAAPSQSD